VTFAWPALAALFCGVAATVQPASAQGTPAVEASLVADAMQGQLPMEANGIIMRRVHAEGDLLVITVEFPPGATDLDHTEYVRGFIIGACETQPNPLFESRVRLRIDTYARGGAARQSEVFTRCPAAPGA